ncbi:Clp, N terminal domain protein, partial [Vibrio parahaemolyticus VPTS-2010]
MLLAQETVRRVSPVGNDAQELDLSQSTFCIPTMLLLRLSLLH